MHPQCAARKALTLRALAEPRLFFKSLTSLGPPISQRSSSVGMRAAQWLGLIIDRNNHFRCPEGASTAQQLTNSRGLGCIFPSGAASAAVGQAVRQGGNTLSLGGDIKKGKVLARKGRGFRIPAGELVDENLKITDDGVAALYAWVEEVLDDFDEAKDGAQRTGIGIEMDDEGHLIFDVVDIFDESVPDERIVELGRGRGERAAWSLGDSRSISIGETTGKPMVDAPDITTAKRSLRDLRLESVPRVRKATTVDSGELAETRRIMGMDGLDIETLDPKERAKAIKTIAASNIPGMPDLVDKKGNPLPDAEERAISYLTDNLMSVFRVSHENDPEAARRARLWYRLANSYGHRIAEDVGVPEEVVHAIMAGDSPKNFWDANVAQGEHMVRALAADIEITDDIIPYILDKIKSRKVHKYQRDNIAKAEENIKKIREMIADLGNSDEDARLRQSYMQTIKRLELLISETQADIDGVEETRRATAEGLRGRKLSELPDDLAALAIMAHADARGMELVDLSISGDSWTEEERSGPLSAMTLVVDPDNLTYSLKAMRTKTGKAQSAAPGFTTPYLKAVKLWRRGMYGDEDNRKIDWDMIDYVIGDQSKVRSFFWNLSWPNDKAYKNTTIDTHAGAAGYLLPFASDDPEIDKLLFAGAGKKGYGLAWPIFREAYKRAATQIGEIIKDDRLGELLPNEAQSIIWEAIRIFFNDTRKGAMKELGFMGPIMEKVKNGEMTRQELEGFLDNLFKFLRKADNLTDAGFQAALAGFIKEMGV